MTDTELPYNIHDANSVVEYAFELIGKTLREAANVDEIADPKRRKGSLGNAIEYYYFHMDPNSRSAPDFEEVGIELKVTPRKLTKKGERVAKERLVISMINYMDVVNEEFETSSLMHKADDMLLIFYLYDKDKDPLDYDIEIVARWGIPDEDLPIIKKDWETVVNKVRAGLAHELSGSDTLYLEACTKSSNSSVRREQPFSDIPAKPRAWAFKASYMTNVAAGLDEGMQSIERKQGEEEASLFDLVRERFAPYFGQTEQELAETFGYAREGKRPPKNLCALITKKILGVTEDAKIAEFEKAGIQTKTLRLQKNGRPKEAVSFPYFDYCELVETPFEESDLHEQLSTRFMFVLFRESEEEPGVYRLADIAFWQMPDADLEEAQACYEEMQRRVRDGHAEDSVKSSENRCCHVRPHGRNAQDTNMTPYGVPVIKKCFWLNQAYLKDEIEKITQNRS